jgi:hypothetical protein
MNLELKIKKGVIILIGTVELPLSMNICVVVYAIGRRMF